MTALRRNRELALVRRELARAGITPVIRVGGKHLRISWERDGKPRTVIVPQSPSDWRGGRNARARVRRILRGDQS